MNFRTKSVGVNMIFLQIQLLILGVRTCKLRIHHFGVSLARDIVGPGTKTVDWRQNQIDLPDSPPNKKKSTVRMSQILSSHNFCREPFKTK